MFLERFGHRVSVRRKIALTIFFTGLLTALGVVATVWVAFQRLDHENTYHRANAFLARVVVRHGDMLDLQQRRPEEFTELLRTVLLFEPNSQLYLLDAQGTVLASSGTVLHVPGFKVSLKPVQLAASDQPMPYVMGDDPERMQADAVIAAKPLRRAVIRPGTGVDGYLYMVCHQPGLPQGGWQSLRSSFAVPTLVLLMAFVGLTTALAAWIVASVTRPLRLLTERVDAVAKAGIEAGAQAHQFAMPPTHRQDEFGRLTDGFGRMLTALRQQWEALRRLDHFRREGVSNLSHDLRSPLTATTACLETLQSRCEGDPTRSEDQTLIAVALRNTRNAARLVQSMGDLAQLDEPTYSLRKQRVDLRELLDDIALRFEPKAQACGMRMRVELPEDALAAEVDVELLERALANLVDNALKYAGPGAEVCLHAEAEGNQVSLCVSDTGPGIDAESLPLLFDRFYQARKSVAPATGEGGKGLGLAIVRRIAELHGGGVQVASQLGQGTHVSLLLPA